ncbi:retrovirus-related pol polyprotein from transposon TNT 1-94 [Tanacetum coccineum]
MGGRKQKSKYSLDWASKKAPVTSNFSVSARNMRKSDLGAVIFGLPGPHFQYIKNIREGLALFLFNYHDRKLHGIFEAAGPGQMNIDRYAWVQKGDNTGYTSFPAQVGVRVKMECLALSENQFKSMERNNGTEFVNQTLREYYEKVGISHETSVACSPQQNGIVERRNHTLIEAARTMLIYAKAPLFLWAEAVATTCYTQNCSMIRRHHGKTPYELLHDKPPDLSYLHVFGALCYPTNDSENLGKLQPKANIGIFIGY